MDDREKVIEGLRTIVHEMQAEVEEWKDYSDSEISYGVVVDCNWWLDALKKCEAALELLKAQEARVMTLSEMNDKRGRGEAVYYEDRDATCKSQDVFVVAPDKDLDVVWLKAETYTLAAKMSTMGKTWRCWTSRPDEKVRAETPWE